MVRFLLAPTPLTPAASPQQSAERPLHRHSIVTQLQPASLAVVVVATAAHLVTVMAAVRSSTRAPSKRVAVAEETAALAAMRPGQAVAPVALGLRPVSLALRLVTEAEAEAEGHPADLRMAVLVRVAVVLVETSTIPAQQARQTPEAVAARVVVHSQLAPVVGRASSSCVT